MTPKTPAITELLRFKTLRLPRGFQFPFHLHHFFQLDVVLAGEHTLLVEGEPPFRGRAGDGWLISPLVRHGFESRENSVIADFKFQIAPALWPLIGTDVRCHRFKPFLLQAVKEIDRRAPKLPSLVYAEAAATATLCLMDFLRKRPPSGSGAGDRMDSFRQSLWPVLARVETTPYSNWSVSTMAEQCHLSTDHFSKCFRQTLGLTPQRYLLEARMIAASNDLLATPPIPIKKVAEASNYSTVHAFSLAFKKVFHTSPAAYRRARTTLLDVSEAPTRSQFA